MTPPRFADGEACLAWEALQTERHEYVGGEILAMTGARAAHNLIAGNGYIGLRQGLRGAPCSVVVNNLKRLINPEGDCLYPDGVVACDPRGRQPGEDRFISPSWLIGEVLDAMGQPWPVANLFDDVDFSPAAAPTPPLPQAEPPPA